MTAARVHTIETLFGATHRFIPPGCKNANADVESIHSTIETEFYDIERFGDRRQFLQKATTYQLWYNIARKNSSRDWKSPLDLLEQKAPELDARILLLHPVDLGRLWLSQPSRHPPVAHHLPVHPGKEWFLEDFEQLQRQHHRRFLEQLMGYERQCFLNAAPYQRRAERTDQANGFYHRHLSTRLGVLTLAVPRTRSGLFRPQVLPRCQRREPAVDAAIREVFLRGVSTRQTGRALATLVEEAVSAAGCCC